jgi:tetratricopeptide (TPR) repeat protein
LVAVALLALGASSARADDAQKARELFSQGNTFFDLGQFDKAIDAWQKGYQLHNDPGFLYNIAQAYRTEGDAQKAVFFYKRYLSNAPKAHNRAEVEQKIEALQKQLSMQEQVKDLPPPGPFGPGNPGGTGSTTPPPSDATGTQPPPASTGPSVAVTGGTTPPPVDGSTGTPVVTTTEVPQSTPPPHRIDLRAALGFDAWSSGLQENAAPSFAFTLAGGYTFGNPASQVRFRLGALFGYTFLKEAASKDTFISFLVDPTIVIRLAPKLALMGDFGIGVMSISGLKPTSALLESSMVNVNGSQALTVIRIGVAGEYDLTQNLSIFLWPAYANSPKKQYFYQDIARFEILAGVAYRP